MPTVSPATLSLSLRRLLFWAFFVGVALTSLRVRQIDLWWQLPEGLSILGTGHLPHRPPAAFGLPHQPFVDEYSLYEIALALAYRLGGLNAIGLGFVATYLLIFLLPLLASLRRAGDLPFFGCLALALVFMVNRYEQRPELVGVLLLVVLLKLLLRTNVFSPGFLLRVALLLAIWTNVHSSYVIGLLALSLWLVDRTFLDQRSRRWTVPQALVLFAAACGAVLVNPYGWKRVAFTFEQERDLGSNLLSREMWPAWVQPPLLQALMLVTAAILVISFLVRPRPPAWLIAVAVSAFLLTLFNIRHMSFLAVALLFISIHRPDAPSRRRDYLRVFILGAACIVLFIFDHLAAIEASRELGPGRWKSDADFAPSLANALSRQGAATVLCHDAEGSYLTLAHRGLFPLIDSGQGRFDNDTKRFYFFSVQDPHAFDLALQRLDVNAVLITRPSLAWTSAIVCRTGWHFTAADPQGLLFTRNLPGNFQAPLPLAFTEAARLRSLRDAALASGDPLWAFCYSLLVDDPAESLALLDRSRPSHWFEAFFSFTSAWVASLPPDRVAVFLQAHPGSGNPLLRELLLARSPSSTPLPPAGPMHLVRLARVLTLLQRYQLREARVMFSAIPPPLVSPLYYTLRDRLDPTAKPRASPSQRWQDWNAGGEELFRLLPPRLNQRAAQLSPFRPPER